MIPEPMRPAPAPAVTGGRRLRRSPVRRAAQALARALPPATRPAEGGGLLHRLEPRAKLVGLGVLVITTTLLHQVGLIAALYAASLVVGAVSRVRIGSLARVWIAVPLFSAAIVLPAALNVVTPGPALATLWRFQPDAHLGPWHLPPALTITAPGVVVAGRFVLRTATCLSLVVLLTATTPPSALLGALRGLGLPRVFVMVATMMRRYLEVLLRSAHELHLAKLSRTVGTGSARGERWWAAAGIAALFRKTVALAQDVYLAMVSRGYSGEARLLRPARLAWRDAVWIGACCAVSACAIAAGRLWVGG